MSEATVTRARRKTRVGVVVSDKMELCGSDVFTFLCFEWHF